MLYFPIISAMTKKVKPNQPCSCGSGFKFKKCCGLQGGKTSSNDAAASCHHPMEEQCYDCVPSSLSQQNYRFRIGDRVVANHAGYWHPGTIVALDYTEPGWLGDVPYQIRLDDSAKGGLIYAPFDCDDCVRRLEQNSTVTRIMKRRRRPSTMTE